MYVKMVPSADQNRNTEWFTYPGVWTTYISLLLFPWLILLSVTNCTPGFAWTIVNLAHFAVTYHCFHWKKGTPFGDDQGIYNRLTWWEQIENGEQLTRNRKFLTLVPVVLIFFTILVIYVSLLFGLLPEVFCCVIFWRYLITIHTTDYQQPMLFLNTIAMLVLVIAKFPNMHKVRIFGINGNQ